MADNVILELGTLLVAALGAGLALRQWSVARRWKREELAASYLKPLLEDAELVFALRCLDWGTGTFPVPERHLPMMKPHETIEHRPDLLVDALTPRPHGWVFQDPQAMLYRLTIDALFTRFEWIGHRVASGLIEIEDVPDLSYWMKLIASWDYAPEDADKTRSELKRRVFIRFLKAADYRATLDLMVRFRAITCQERGRELTAAELGPV